jgi:poly(3-hydroxybutyrate) depolymerase
MRPCAVLLQLLVVLPKPAAALRPSGGCRQNASGLNASAGGLTPFQLSVTDRHNLTMSRSYVLNLPPGPSPGPACNPGAQPPQLCPGVPASPCPPSGVCPSNTEPRKPVPLLLYFHGQGATATDAATTITNFVGVGNVNGFASVFLQGVGDEDGNCTSGWNVGGDSFPGGTGSMCTRLAWSEFGCHCSCCYQSCQALGHCTADGEGARCGWTTCFEDVDFVQQLLAVLQREVCLDMDQIYISGESNGGMMVYHLVRELPGTFAGIMPIYGLPLKGIADDRGALSPYLQDTSIMHWHDRWDNVIPTDGTLSSQGWAYDTLNRTLAQWIDLHNCTQAANPIATPGAGGTDGTALRRRVECVEWAGCSTGKTVISCEFDGQHGNWMQDNLLEDAFAWFLQHQQQQQQEAPRHRNTTAKAS